MQTKYKNADKGTKMFFFFGELLLQEDQNRRFQADIEQDTAALNGLGVSWDDDACPYEAIMAYLHVCALYFIVKTFICECQLNTGLSQSSCFQSSPLSQMNPKIIKNKKIAGHWNGLDGTCNLGWINAFTDQMPPLSTKCCKRT